jgi:hypothetical protein
MAGEHHKPEDQTQQSPIQLKDAWVPPQRHAPSPANDATMVLPVYSPPATAPASIAAAPAAPKAATPPPTTPQKKSGKAKRPDALPSDERNMLIFVSALLFAGTLAIVAMASIGR